MTFVVKIIAAKSKKNKPLSHEFQRAGRPDLGVQQILQVFDFALFEHPKAVSLGHKKGSTGSPTIRTVSSGWRLSLSKDGA
ncbi:hypothetical protein [Ravibacter arvi]|uniref:hypothetical protein n=1 Tax=Ravibacter arvi TaxID=2051041 RepID=UPI0031EFA27F